MLALKLSPIIGAAGLAIVLVFSSSSPAQSISDPDSLSKNSSNWSQEERELGFAHFDAVFEARDVPNGDKVRELPQGVPIAAFREGGEKEKELEEFLTEQKVAGLIILQDGMIRLERYALGHNETGRWTSQSVAKSVTSTLLGAAIKHGFPASDRSITLKVSRSDVAFFLLQQLESDEYIRKTPALSY